MALKLGTLLPQNWKYRPGADLVGVAPFGEVPAAGRAPYTGSIDQILDDLAELAAGGVDEVILTLPFVANGINELNDLAAEFHGKFHAAGL